MADARTGLLASFAYLDSTVDAIKGLKKAGFDKLTAYTPYPEHHIEQAMGWEQSPVRVWTLVGGLTGTATGFAFTMWTSMDWPLVTGGKPILSIPAYVVIAFELTILFGALATIIGLFINSRLPHTKPIVVYDPEFSAGRFGLYVSVAAERLEEARSILEKSEPEEIREDKEGVLMRPDSSFGLHPRGAARAWAVLLLVALGAGACKPLDDTMATIFGRNMRSSRSFDPYENPRPPAENTVAFSSGNYPAAEGEVNVGQPEGLAEDVPPIVPQDMVPPGAAHVRGLVNTVAADSASLARGQVLFDRFCVVCHGPQGLSAQAPVVPKMPMVMAFNLANGPSVFYEDGYIYGMIRVGRGLMPPYGNRVSHFDRWNIVNYVRQLQRDAGMTPAPDLVGAQGPGGEG